MLLNPRTLGFQDRSWVLGASANLLYMYTLYMMVRNNPDEDLSCTRSTSRVACDTRDIRDTRGTRDP